MDYQIMTSPADEDENLLFAFMLSHKAELIKGAVAEKILGESIQFDVLLQSKDGNRCFTLSLDENDAWCTNDSGIHAEIIDQIGETIKSIME